MSPHVKDAEAAGRYVIDYVEGKRRYARNVSVDVIYRLAVFAFHWANKSS